MLRSIKPRNARSKRAMEARAPKEIEDPRTALFVRGTHTGAVVRAAMTDLMALKSPHAIAFSKKNVVRPFEDPSSLAFWSAKTDASLFLLGQSTKRRPNGLVLARTYDGRVLDLCELGVDGYVRMGAVRAPLAGVGQAPLMHFASPAFESEPRYVQLKSLLMDLFGARREGVCLEGLGHVISVTVAPGGGVHLRTYAVQSGGRELLEMGPSLDLSLRRADAGEEEMWKAAMKRPKMAKREVASGLGKRRRNVEVDEMGDLRGRVHVSGQDLGALQTRKMKALRVS